MELKFTPSFFYGSAAAALMGLSLGMALHGPWQSKAGGPRLMFGSAAAAEQAQDGETIQASADATQTADATLYDGSLPAAPLPVVRLKPDRYPDIWSSWQGVTQASVDEGQRVNPDDLYKADVFADDERPDRRFDDDRRRDNWRGDDGRVDEGNLDEDDELPAAPRPYIPRDYPPRGYYAPRAYAPPPYPAGSYAPRYSSANTQDAADPYDRF